VLSAERYGDASGGTLIRGRARELAELDDELLVIQIALEGDAGVDRVPSGAVLCPHCGALAGALDQHCSTCGTRLSDGAVPAQFSVPAEPSDS